MAKNKSVFGIYSSRSGVENAVTTLKDSGFQHSDVSVLLPENLGSREIATEKNTKAPEGATTGAGSGAVIGGTLGWLVGMLLGYFTRSLGLGVMDRVIGVLFGILRGVVLVGLIVIGGELLHLNHEEWWNRSKLVPYGETVGDWLRAMVGEKGDPWAKLERLTGVRVRPK